MDIFSKYAWVIHLKDEKSLQPQMIFKEFYMNQNANQTKYGWTKGANFTIDHEKHGCKIAIYKCIQQIMEKNLLLLKDLLKL